MGPWLPIARLKLPLLPLIQADPVAAKIFTIGLKEVYVLTKGRQTHILRSPLPNPLSSVKPLLEIRWKEQPSEIIPRICTRTEPEHLTSNTSPNPDSTTIMQELHLQLIGFNAMGVEIIEIPLLAICAASRAELATQTSGLGNGRGRALPSPPAIDHVRAQMDLGGETTFLSIGGQWHDYKGFNGLQQLGRTPSTTSSFVATEQEDRSGIYACYEKEPNDYRVFFMGDCVKGDEVLEDESDGF